tara:strand:- start:964 stop:1374 length:411 start_codon:yes stop_codon:yes gene_type:complete
MSKLNQKLSEVLDIEPIDIEPTPVVVADTTEDDAEFARKNIRNLIEKGNVAMDNLLHVAKESEHPRAYEVAAGMIKNLSDLNKDLLEIQKRKKDLTGESLTAKNINVDKAVFVGSTTELVKFLKNKDNYGTTNSTT